MNVLSIFVPLWGIFELREMEREARMDARMDTLGCTSWHPPNYIRHGSVRLEHVAGDVLQLKILYSRYQCIELPHYKYSKSDSRMILRGC